MLNKYYRIIYFFFGFAIAQDSSFTFQQNDYVNIPNSESIQPISAMTIECWVNPEQEGYSNFDPIVQYLRLTSNGEESGFSIIFYEGMFRFVVGVSLLFLNGRFDMQYAMESFHDQSWPC